MRLYQTGISLVVWCVIFIGSANGLCFAQTPLENELVYTAEDLDPPPVAAGVENLDDSLRTLVDKAIQRNPLLQILVALKPDKTRKFFDNLADLDRKWKMLDPQFRADVMGLLSRKAQFDLAMGMRMLRGVKGGAAIQQRLESALGGFQKLREMAQREDRQGESGRFGFLSGTVRELMARNTTGVSPQQRRNMLASARDEYHDAYEDLRKTPDPTGAVTADDALEKVRVLDQPFGGILPLLAPEDRVVRLTSDLGQRVHPIKKKVLYHKGIDLADPNCNGWNVCAFGPGKIVYSGWERGYGYVEVVAHELDGKPVYTRYAHLRKAGRTPAGQIVSRGDRIGICNNTGGSTGSHLHFEVRAGDSFGAVLDPKIWLPPVEKAARFKALKPISSSPTGEESEHEE